ncbi:MAG TPA: hypothetical protein VM925_31760, partial [Labilithrix sp.]|nr:hypothetical protein [Labilithrix sp.]
MRALHLVVLSGLAAVTTSAFIAACVGDDPIAGQSTPPSLDGGNNANTDDAGATSIDGSGGNVTDGSTDAGGDGAAPLDVRTLPGLRLWLE